MLDTTTKTKIEAASVHYVTDAELLKLPEHQRVVAEAFLVEHQKYSVIALRCGIKIGTVRSRLNRARLAIIKMREAV